ncbi:M48 family metalloprotease [Sphingopyxis sp. XHP0097]|uniref:M48 family metalloprotease n=1 Tax=Sphingopyxis jiangsuensis TaxID=2871171 RepID=A0ABS7MFT6_9SPHN|nr:MULTISPECIES: M48 family metalloprotease [Sphingopyxis]MBL0769242.1 M48 family metalloprotease [Sphingopyxis lutea]MBY4637652.1 M48 family metalloprotease [Sphingopyxis jiangsuensis]
MKSVPSLRAPQYGTWRAVIRVLLTVAAVVALAARPALAQSILRDAETEALFQDMMDPLVVAAGLQRGQVRVHLLGDSSINAFVAGSQDIYVFSGLIEAADSAEEVQGVLAHELGHIMGGHAIRVNDGAKTATGISLLSMLLGAAAIAAGGAEAGMGIMMAGQQAALGKFLAFSRVQESTADAAGAQYLSTAGISGRGSLAFFKKLQNLEFRYGIRQDDDQVYGRTHPMSGDRIQTLREVYVVDPAWEKPADPDIERRFQRIKAKLSGFTAEPERTLRKFPESNTSIPARYARAYAWHKSAYPQKALAEVEGLLAIDAEDPYFLELEGQVLLESGRPKDAIAPLRKAVANSRAQPLIAATLGHALIATEDPANFAEAEKVLKTAVALDNQNPFAWYQLGIVYANKGDQPRAALASAERFQLMGGQAPLALRNAEMAMQGLPQGTPDWIRAQDISLVARAEVERTRKRR